MFEKKCFCECSFLPQKKVISIPIVILVCLSRKANLILQAAPLKLIRQVGWMCTKPKKELNSKKQRTSSNGRAQQRWRRQS